MEVRLLHIEVGVTNGEPLKGLRLGAIKLLNQFGAKPKHTYAGRRLD